VDAPTSVRFSRLVGRFGSYKQFQEADAQLVEAHIDTLKPLADLVLGGEGADELAETSIRQLIRDFRKRMVA
jgi:hypothetical protein